MPTERGASDVSDSAVRAQLDSILASAIFSRSPHLRRFLSFIVEQTLAGRGHRLKESVLAHELYGRGTDFDGGSDPVVRVDARRLRDKLREFYDGRRDPVLISLPKGSYMPVFETRPASAAVLPEQPAGTHRTRTSLLLGAFAVAAAVATVISWRALNRPADAPPTQLLPLASFPGVEGPPAMSPDGELVAFAWSGHDTGPTDIPTDIYVKAIGNEALRQLTNTPDWESSPAWSPDGHDIAFVRNDQGVFILSQLGGAERRVSASGTQVSWGGDAKSVLIRDRDGTAGPFGIYQVFLDTLERRRLTQAPIGFGDWRFEVSPDGATLAFIRYERPAIADLYVMPMRGDEPRRLSNWSATLTGLAWTPDGREIVYSVEEPAAGRLWRIAANSTRPTRGSPVADIPVSAEHPSISRSQHGQPARLAFQTVTRDVDLLLMDLEARPVDGTIQSRPFANSTRIEASARFSPDGKRIALVSFRSGGPEIWLAERDRTELRQITSLGAPHVFVGGWSPDGQNLAFDAAIDGNSDIFLVGQDGGHLRRLTSEPSIDGIPSWSADGRWIYFASTRAGVIPDIWRVSPKGGAAVRVTRNGRFEPQESADGRYLFYLDRNPGGLLEGTARLLRAPLAGGAEEVVLEHVRPFLWAVTASGIVFLTREADFDAIDVYRFSDGQTARVGRLGFRLPEIFDQMAVSHDGRWLLASRLVRFDSDLMRLDNFR
jgi:Tol biopolymer transport system component